MWHNSENKGIFMSRNEETINYLKTRRSVPLPFLQEPAPTSAELEEILTIGTRVPDHGKIVPWRLISYSGDARVKIGEKLAALALKRNPDMDEDAIKAEKKQFLPAPVTIGVISKTSEHFKVSELEQILSAGAVALNLVHGANALGFGAHWVTRWFAYDDEAAKMLGASEGEQFVAFVHIGTASRRLEERDRPDLKEVVSEWVG